MIYGGDWEKIPYEQKQVFLRVFDNLPDVYQLDVWNPYGPLWKLYMYRGDPGFHLDHIGTSEGPREDELKSWVGRMVKGIEELRASNDPRIQNRENLRQIDQTEYVKLRMGDHARGLSTSELDEAAAKGELAGLEFLKEPEKNPTVSIWYPGKTGATRDHLTEDLPVLSLERLGLI